MNCGCCGQQNVNDLDNMFGVKRANGDAKRYLKKGLDKRGQKLIAYLLDHRQERPFSVLYIGCGAGGLHHEMLRQGVAGQVAGVDAASAFLAAAQANAVQLNLSEAVTYTQRDFAQLPDDFEPADVVTMDRVICCYPYLQQLLGAAAQRANRYLVLSFPLDDWWIRIVYRVLNGLISLFRRDGFHSYVHPHTQVLEIAQAAGLQPVHHDRSGIWQIMVFARAS